MLRRETLRYATALLSVAVTAGCTEKTDTGAETPTAAKRQTPVADALPDLPVAERTAVVGRAITETAERNVADFPAFEAVIEREGLSIKSTKKTERIIELKGVVIVDTDRGIAQYVGRVAGAYAAFVRSGAPYDRLNVTLNEQDDSTFGSFQVLSAWSKQFEERNWSAEQYGEAVLGTLKTKR